LILCLLLCTQVSAQESSRTFALSFSPVSAPFGIADVLFQVNLAPFVSLTLPANFTYFWPMHKILEVLDTQSIQLKVSKAPLAIGGGLGARFYPTGKGMASGLYLEPRLLVNYLQFGAKVGDVVSLEWSKTSFS